MNPLHHRNISLLLALLLGIGMIPTKALAEYDEPDKVVIVEKRYRDRDDDKHRWERDRDWDRGGNWGRGELRPAAYDLVRSSDELVLALSDRHGWRGDRGARFAIERLNAEAQSFYRQADDRSVWRLKEDFEDVRRAYDKAEDYFPDLPRNGEVRNAVSRTQLSMRNFERTFHRLLNDRPVDRPVPGPGNFRLARDIERAALDLESYAISLYRRGDYRGDTGRVRIVLNRLNDVADRARDLRVAVERRDNVWHNLRELREAHDDAEERYGVFGSRLNSRYAKLGYLIDSFDDRDGHGYGGHRLAYLK